jgi:hypothetical protein
VGVLAQSRKSPAIDGFGRTLANPLERVVRFEVATDEAACIGPFEEIRYASSLKNSACRSGGNLAASGTRKCFALEQAGELRDEPDAGSRRTPAGGARREIFVTDRADGASWLRSMWRSWNALCARLRPIAAVRSDRSRGGALPSWAGQCSG